MPLPPTWLHLVVTPQRFAALLIPATWRAPPLPLQDLTNKRKVKVPESEYTDGPDGLK